MSAPTCPEADDAIRRGDGSWPVPVNGVVESLVATRTDGDRWNLAALGLHGESPVRARTWGRTRTRRNFERSLETDLQDRETSIVLFTRDPVAFVRAALDVWERGDPILPSTDAWVSVRVERVRTGREAETEWVDWHLHPASWAVCAERVPTIDRGFGAVVEATVAASRLDVPAYDTETLRERIDRLREVAQRCGGQREQDAFELLATLAD